MISSKPSAYLGAGVLSAIAASLCCIMPVVALLARSSSVAANFSWIEPARPYLIGFSVLVLLFAWYQKLKPSKATDMNCCSTNKKPSFMQTKAFLGIVTVFAVLMMTFPLYAKVFYPAPKIQTLAASTVDNKQQVKFTIQGMTCAGCEEHVNKELSAVNGVIAYKTSYATKSSLVTYDKTKVDVKAIEAAINKTGYKVIRYEAIALVATQVSFYEVPLVCQAAPTIGCGSKAKFILTDLEKKSSLVEGAWLNRSGTVIAVKWKKSGAAERENVVNTVGSVHHVELNVLSTTAALAYAKSFPNSGQWYKGEEVDQLSKEEAIIIAKNTVNGYRKDGLIPPAYEKEFEADIAKIYTDLFLRIKSYSDLSQEAYNSVEKQIQAAGEKYVGKGKMPHVELCKSDDSCENASKACKKDQSCNQGESKTKSCCKKD